jgi:hypothetical protein
MQVRDDEYPLSPRNMLHVLTHVRNHGAWDWEKISPIVGLPASQLEEMWEKNLQYKFPPSGLGDAIHAMELRARPFSQSDDDAIRTAVYAEGIGEVDWSRLAHRLGRSARLVRAHYCSEIEDLVYSWKPQEDAQIREIFKEVGPRWKEIARTLINRRWAEVRARYYFLKAQDRLEAAVARGVRQEAITRERRRENERLALARRPEQISTCSEPAQPATPGEIATACHSPALSGGELTSAPPPAMK